MIDGVVDEEKRTFMKKYMVNHAQLGDNTVARPEGNIRLLNTLSFESELMCCRFSPSGKLLALGLSNGNIKVYSTESKSTVYCIPSPGDNNNLPVTCIRWKPTDSREQQAYGNIILATYASGEVRRWHVSTGQCLHVNAESAQMLGCSYNNKGSRSVVSTSAGKLNLYDEETGKKIMVMEPSTNVSVMDGHMMRVFVVQYNPNDDNVFVSGGWDDTIQWWDTRVDEKHSIKKIFGPHICGEGLDIEPNSMLIVTASWRKENNLQIFDFGTGREVQSILSDPTCSSKLYCAQWKSTDSVIYGGSHSNMMRVVSLRSTQTIGRVLQLPGAVYSIDNNRRGAHPIIAFCADKYLFLAEDTII